MHTHTNTGCALVLIHVYSLCLIWYDVCVCVCVCVSVLYHCYQVEMAFPLLFLFSSFQLIAHFLMLMATRQG